MLLSSVVSWRALLLPLASAPFAASGQASYRTEYVVAKDGGGDFLRSRLRSTTANAFRIDASQACEYTMDKVLRDWTPSR